MKPLSRKYLGAPLLFTIALFAFTAGQAQDSSEKNQPATRSGEMDAFPAKGHLYEANFNDGLILVHLDFNKDGKQMVFTDAGSKMPGMKPSETINYTAVAVRPMVYLVSWQEQDKMTVVHLEDFEKGEVHSFITAPTGEFYKLAGKLTKLK